MMNVPIVGTPQFPQNNINISPQGLTLTVILGPGCLFQMNYGPDIVDQICAKWGIEKHRNEGIIRALNMSKNGSS